MSDTNAAWKSRKPWRNSTVGAGSRATLKQREYVRNLEEWTGSKPVSDTHLASMTRAGIDAYIETLKHRLDSGQRKPARKDFTVPAEGHSENRPSQKQSELLDKLSVRVDVPVPARAIHCSWCASRAIDEFLTLVRDKRKVAA